MYIKTNSFVNIDFFLVNISGVAHFQQQKQTLRQRPRTGIWRVILIFLYFIFEEYFLLSFYCMLVFCHQFIKDSHWASYLRSILLLFTFIVVSLHLWYFISYLRGDVRFFVLPIIPVSKLLSIFQCQIINEYLSYFAFILERCVNV